MSILSVRSVESSVVSRSKSVRFGFLFLLADAWKSAHNVAESTRSTQRETEKSRSEFVADACVTEGISGFFVCVQFCSRVGRTSSSNSSKKPLEEEKGCVPPYGVRTRERDSDESDGKQGEERREKEKWSICVRRGARREGPS